ncbi:MAG TPA: response regulator [Bacteroidia bacterium]
MNSKPKILVVDDRPENIKAIQVVLQDQEVELITTTSGNDALKATLHHEFALALLDIQMPEMDGFELAAILREEAKTSHLPFIFISAVYTDNFNVFKGYEKGAFSFITKPFQPEILVNKVKFFVEKHQQELQLHKLNETLEEKNKELQFINRELESFSYSVSHDLRAPLRAVNGYSRILKEEYASYLNEEGNKLLGNIQYNANRMNSLIDDLLAFSRMGRKELQKTDVDMDSIVHEIASELKEATHHKATVTISSILPAEADQSLIRQVWINLISNAIKYSEKKEHPVVEIGSEKTENGTMYFVKDNGAGFDMEYASKLFGVFQRLHDQDDFEGTGIGLAIVQRIINRHGGRIWADAKVNEGANFYFTLPAAD